LNDLVDLEEYPADSFQEYLKFLAKYSKTHLKEEEFYQRYRVFRTNYKRIIDHNSIPDSGFELEVN
jgi:hypothetical protein